MDQMDREEVRRTMAAVLFGQNNKKRKRNEVEGLDEDDNGRRKLRLIEERWRQLNGTDTIPSAEDMINAVNEYEEQEAVKRESKRLQQMKEEEELSEGELQK